DRCRHGAITILPLGERRGSISSLPPGWSNTRRVDARTVIDEAHDRSSPRATMGAWTSRDASPRPIGAAKRVMSTRWQCRAGAFSEDNEHEQFADGAGASLRRGSRARAELGMDPGGGYRHGARGNDRHRRAAARLRAHGPVSRLG